MSHKATTTGANRPEKQPRPVLVLQLTDFHFLAETGQTMVGVDTERSFKESLSAALRSDRRPDLALLTGDLVQDACRSGYARVRESLEGLDFPCYCLPGNHDEASMMAQILDGGSIHCRSRILLDRWQIICLDSTIPGEPGGRIAQSQLVLLETLLAEQPDRFALVALHHHPIASGSRWMDTMIIDNADDLFAVLTKYHQVKAMVFGHVHQVMDVVRHDIRLLAAPSTCFQFKPQQTDFSIDEIPPGFRWIELYPDGHIDTWVERLAAVPEGLNPALHGY